MIKKIDFKHISEFQLPGESPGYLLWRVSIAWRNTIEKTLKDFGLTHPQFVVLAALGWLTQGGKKVSQADVGKMAGLDPNTTSQILRGLERKKLIKRVQKVDERSKNPTLTETGIDILSQAMPAVEKADESFFATINPKELVSLNQLFQKLMPRL